MKKYATVRPLVPRNSTDVRKGFRKLVAELKGFEGEGRIQFRILGRKSEHWVLELYGGRSAFRRATVKNPDFELLTRKETWNAIASGRLSPADAFLQGKMRVRGNVELGQRLFERLAGSVGDLKIC